MFDLNAYSTINALFPRLLGIIYFFAIGAFIFQIKGLIGKNGILPISDFLRLIRTYYGNKCYLRIPSLFWLNSSDQALMGIIVVGTLLSICLILGFYPSLMLFLLYFLYLSIVSTGQDFLGFGWEGFLLEVTAHAFLLSLTPIPNLMAWISTNFLLFRFHFQAGAVKLQSQDKSWKERTALAYHYQTQPLPNTIAWFFHKLPLSFHKASALLMFIIELIVPVGIFLTHEIRATVFIAFTGLQLMIWLTGNFSYLNHLTAVFCTILLSNSFLAGMIHFSHSNHEISLTVTIIISILSTTLFILQIIRFWHHFSPTPFFGKILNQLAPFHLANRYGIFAVMTTERYEVVIEGSEDNQTWKEYTFQYKPSEITRRPHRISPYQPRIDWQAWFLPFTDFYTEKWFQNFLYHLLKGTPEVIQLLRDNPFPDNPPKYIRTLFYEYEFSTFEELKKKGWWWRRQLIGHYSPVMTLKNSSMRRA
jgi:hypothetical protein